MADVDLTDGGTVTLDDSTSSGVLVVPVDFAAGSITLDNCAVAGVAAVPISFTAGSITLADCAVIPGYISRTPLQVDLSHRYEAFQGLEVDLSHRYVSYQSIFRDMQVLYSSASPGEFWAVEKNLSHRYESCKKLAKDLQHRYQSFPEVVVGSGMPAIAPPGITYGTGQPELPPNISKWELQWRFGYCLPEDFSIDINIAGPEVDGDVKNLGCIPNAMTISYPESGPSTWGFSLQERAGYYHPMNQSSPWYKVMDEEPLMSATTVTIHGQPIPSGVVVRKEMQATINLADTQHIFHGLGTAWDHSRASKDQLINFTWKGVDHSQKLFVEHQTMRDVISNKYRGNRYSQEVMAEILNKFSVKFDFSHLPDNFPIPFLSRQSGRPIDWIQQILNCSLAEWRMVDGITFTPYLPEIAVAPSYVYFLDGPGVCDTESYQASMQNVYNHVIVVRAADVGGAATAPMEVDEFKEYEYTFPVPVNGPLWSIVQAQGGAFSDYICYNPSGNVIAVREPRPESGLIGSMADFLFISGYIQNCAKIKFTWGHLPVTPGDGVTGGYGKIQFTGTPNINSDNYGGSQFDGQASQSDPLPGFRAEAIDLPSVAKYGYRPIELQANPLLPTKQAAQIHAGRYLYRLLRQAREATYKVPLNTDLYPGTVVGEVDKKFGYTKLAPRMRLLTRVTHNFSQRPEERYTTYTGNEYPDGSGIVTGILPGIGALIH